MRNCENETDVGTTGVPSQEVACIISAWGPKCQSKKENKLNFRNLELFRTKFIKF